MHAWHIGEARRTLYAIIKGKNMDTLAVFNVVARMDGSHITELDAEIITGDCTSNGRLALATGEHLSNVSFTLVELDLALVNIV